MLSSSRNRKRGSVAAMVFLAGAAAHFVSAQTGAEQTSSARPAVAPSKPANTGQQAGVNVNDPRLKKYLDAKGGYTDSLGGYFDPTAGTYTTKDGGVVDNWRGITAKDGSYKTAKGDWFDAPNHTVHMSDGSQAKLPATAEQARKVMRDDIEQAGGYDKNFILTKMMEQIAKEHPLGSEQSTKAQTPTVTIDPRLRAYLDAKGGYKDHFGGYYNPNAGTYTDEEGGIVDNWGGYTYKDGSYKSKFGDFWDAPTHTFKFAAGGEKQATDFSNADAIRLMRQTVEENGGYDKDFVVKSMITSISSEHPLGAARTH
jgi:hypothetical protein